MSNNKKSQQNGFYALHVLKSHNDKQKQLQSLLRKSSIQSTSISATQQTQQQQQNTLQNQSKVSEAKSVNQSKINVQHSSDIGKATSSRGKSVSAYADYIAEKANEYRQHKNSRFEHKMQPMPSQNSERSPKGFNSVWSMEKENRFEWIGKDQNKYFHEINGNLKSYDETSNKSSNPSTLGCWQNLIDKTPQSELYQKKRSVSREGQVCQSGNTIRVIFPDQQETPRFNQCFKSVLMKEQINPLKLEERVRESKIQKKYEKSLERYEKIENKGIIPDTQGREIAISRRKSTEIKKKYDYSSQVALKTEEGQPSKQSPSRLRIMYEEAYNNNMNNLIFHTTEASPINNDSSKLDKKIPKSKDIQSITKLNSNSNSNQENIKPTITSQINMGERNSNSNQNTKNNTLVNNYFENNKNTIVPNQYDVLRESNLNAKPPLNNQSYIETKQERKIENPSSPVKRAQQDRQSRNNTEANIFNSNSKNNRNNHSIDSKSNYQTPQNQENRTPINKKMNFELQSRVANDDEKKRYLSREQIYVQPQNVNQGQTINSQRENTQGQTSASKSPISARNYYNADYNFNENRRQRSNSKKRNSQSDVFMTGDRLWTDIREQKIEELNRDPSRERIRTNPSDRQNYSGNSDFWMSQKQDTLWKQELKLKEIQANKIVLPNQKVNRRSNSISCNIQTGQTPNNSQFNNPYTSHSSNSKQININQNVTPTNSVIQPIQPSTARENYDPQQNKDSLKQSGVNTFQQQSSSLDKRTKQNNPNNNNSYNMNILIHYGDQNNNNKLNQSGKVSDFNASLNGQNRQNNFNLQDRLFNQFDSQARQNSRSRTPKQYDHSPQQRAQTAGDIFAKQDRDQTPKQFNNIDFSDARAIKEKMQRSQIQF